MTNAARAGTFDIGGDMRVNRMGFGAMRLTGPGVWGPPEDAENARAVLRRAIELGINFIDTADVYGPGDNEQLIWGALNPYPPGLVIGTKGGLVRTEAHIRTAIEGSLRDLGVPCIDLYQLHRIDPATPIETTMRVFKALREEGKIRHIGLSEVSIENIERARSIVEIASVQNVYNLATRKHENVLAYCERNDIAFIPFWPLHHDTLAHSKAMTEIVEREAVTPAQIAIAWLLKKSPSIILIPGTSSIWHLEQNVAACEVRLPEADMEILERLWL